MSSTSGSAIQVEEPGPLIHQGVGRKTENTTPGNAQGTTQWHSGAAAARLPSTAGDGDHVMVTEEVTVQDAPELRTENVLRITLDDRERVVGWCRENLKGPWQLIRRAFAGEDADAVKDAAQREKVREVRFQKGTDPLVYRFEIWELRIEEPEEAASAKLALT